MDEKAKFEALKDLALSDAGRIFIEDIRANKTSSDTILGHNSTNDMLVASGYVQGLDWAIGILEHYQTAQYEELNEEIEE